VQKLRFGFPRRDHGRQAAGKKAALQRIADKTIRCRKQLSLKEETWQLKLQ
jgi:hypothetical protein